MALTEEHATWFAKTFSMIVENVAKALLGKEEVIRLALTARTNTEAELLAG